jgi:hypothetical protein
MVSIDLVDPQPMSHRRNVWLLVMQDRLSKWLELAALRKATSANVVAKVRQRIILRYGCPETIISDNGRQFVSRHFCKFLKDCGIQHRKTPPYTPHCNPVERTNRVIKAVISQFVGRDHKNWNKYLTEISFAYNTAQSAVTGYSPAFLNSGREPVHPGAVHRHVKKPSGKSNLGIRLEKIRDALVLARLNAATSFQKQSRHYNQGRRVWRPTVGDRVMAKTHILSDKDKGINSKLAPRYDGPYVVIALPSPVITTLAHTDTKETRQAHIGDMKPYVSRENTPRRPRGRPRKASEEASPDSPSSPPRSRLENASEAPAVEDASRDPRGWPSKAPEEKSEILPSRSHRGRRTNASEAPTANKQARRPQGGPRRASEGTPRDLPSRSPRGRRTNAPEAPTANKQARRPQGGTSR